MARPLAQFFTFMHIFGRKMELCGESGGEFDDSRWREWQRIGIAIYFYFLNFYTYITFLRLR